MPSKSISRRSLSLLAACLPLVLLACERTPGMLPTTTVSDLPPLVTSAKAAPIAKGSAAREVSLTIRWPSRTGRGTQVIPEDTNAITVRVTGRGITQQKSILRTGTEATSQVAFSLFPGDYTVSVECLFRSAGQDRLLAQQLVDLNVAADQPVAMTIRPVLLPTPSPMPTPFLTPTPEPTQIPTPSPTMSALLLPTPTPEPTPQPTLTSLPTFNPTPMESTTSHLGIAPDDVGNPLETHVYKIRRFAELSSFVWIPRFEAVQIINPSNCGQAYSSLPPGYWVKTPPDNGVPTTDWATESFGGFYVGQFEATNVDSIPGSPENGGGYRQGESYQIKVQRYCVPMVSSWQMANDSCLQLWPGISYLMGGQEFASIAIWSMVNNTTPTGFGMADAGEVVFFEAKQYSHPSRALTGSGKNSRWIGGINWTTHDFSDEGVFDLVGNESEWMADLFAETKDYACRFYNFSLNLPVELTGVGIVSGISTSSQARRLLLPLGLAPPASWDGSYSSTQLALGKVHMDLGRDAQVSRLARGMRNGRSSGYLGMEITNSAGFRPVLKF